MKALITGADGFIGKRLSNHLQTKGFEVYRHDIKSGDIAEKDALRGYPKCDIVYHLAARTYVPDSWNQSQDYYRVNVMGTVNALEYCREHHARLVFMSTYVYGEPQYLPVDEKHPIHPVSPYHESKLLGESLCEFYHKQFGLNILVIRPFNIYGCGQHPAFLMSKVMQQVLDSDCETIEVFDLKPKRDYVYVKDVIHALEKAALFESGYQVCNIGSGESYSVEEVIQSIMRITGIKKDYHATQEIRRTEISDCKACMDNAEKCMGFVPAYTLEKGIIDWLGEIKITQNPE